MVVMVKDVYESVCEKFRYRILKNIENYMKTQVCIKDTKYMDTWASFTWRVIIDSII